jgi:predicted ATP-dependent serine protease
MKFAKETGTPVFLIGHITKDGTIAGPKVLEHMVDTVLQFEGDRHLTYRILRTSKNRFGSTHELGIYEMRAEGLRSVANPSEILLTQREEILNGVAIGAMMEGNRPLLIEIQSLVSPATYGTPQRSSTGHDATQPLEILRTIHSFDPCIACAVHVAGPRGARVTDVVAYRTVADIALLGIVDALRDRRVDAITFSSASTVRHVVEGLGSAGVRLERLPVGTRPRIVCIGPVSAAAARECGLPVDGIADPSDDDGLIAALIRCFANRTALA